MSERASAARGPATTGPGDAVERDADRRARAALDGRVPGMCSACAVGRPCTRKGHGGGLAMVPGGAGDHAALLPGSGRPLPAAERGDFEARFGADLSQVRIHDGAAAAGRARAVEADAFTTGSHIVFGDGRFAPSTPAGRGLLAHELAHVVQGGGGPLRRQPAVPTAASSRAPGGDPPPPPSPSPQAAPAKDPAPAPKFDPCAVDVASLNNLALIKQRADAEAYMAANLGVNDFYLYRSLGKRVITELGKRIAAGDAWLAEAKDGIPAELFVVTTGALDGLEIWTEDVGGLEEHAPRTDPIMTRGQIARLARANDISQEAIDEALANAASGPALMLPDITKDPEPPPIGMFFPGYQFDTPMTRIALDAYRNAPNAGIGTQGALGEFGFRHTDPIGAGPYIDLNNLAGFTSRNFPNYDWFSPNKGVLVQVKTTEKAPGTAWGKPSGASTHAGGFDEITGRPLTNSKTFEKAVAALNNAGMTFTDLDAIAAGFLAINEDHVADARQHVRTMLLEPQTWENFETLFDAHLRQQAVKGYKDWKSVPAADRPAVAADLAGRIELRVVSNGLKTDEVIALGKLRSKFHLLSNDDFTRSISPEIIDATLLGGNSKAMRAAAMRSVAYGAPIAFAGSFGIEGIDSMITGRKFDPGAALRSSIIGTGTGVLTNAAETSAALYASQRALNLGGTTALSPGRARFMAGAGSTVALAAIMSQIELGMDKDSHPWQRYVARGMRASSVGLVGYGAGALAGGLIGAKVAGPWGFVGGLVVGFVAAYAFDKLAGPSIESGVMSILPEPKGCE